MNGPWQSVSNILAVRVDNIGDVIMTSPAIRAIRESVPRAKLTLLASPRGAQPARLMPFFDNIIEYSAPWVDQPDSYDTDAERIIATLRKGNFDAAVIFTVYSQSALPAAFLTLQAGIPRRLAYNHENPYSLLTDWVPDPEPARFVRHEVERSLDLVSRVGWKASSDHLSLPVPPRDTAFDSLLKNSGLDPAVASWILVHPGSSEDIRRYPLDGYITASRTLTLITGMRIVFTGSSGERNLTARAARAVPGAVDMGGKLTFPHLVRLVHLSPLVITNNTGVSHVAAATGVPLVVLYARTNPQHTPWKSNAEVLYFDVPCKACARGVCSTRHPDAAKTVQPEEVVHAGLGLLGSIRRLGYSVGSRV